jgi:energy-coupling factor transporter transmembrane protein EcfT
MYIDRRSVLHNAHPSVKIFCLISIFLYALIIKDIKNILIVLFFILIIGIKVGIWRNIRKSLLFGTIIVLFSSVMWLIFYPNATNNLIAFKYGLAMGLRLVLVFQGGIIFLSVTRIEEFIYGLRKLFFPYKFCFAISLAFRLIPLIYENISIVIEAQRIKGVNLKIGSLKERVKKYAPLFAPVISLIFREANFLTIAAESRGFSHPGIKTEYLYYFIGVREILIIIFTIAIFLVFYI